MFRLDIESSTIKVEGFEQTKKIEELGFPQEIYIRSYYSQDDTRVSYIVFNTNEVGSSLFLKNLFKNSNTVRLSFNKFYNVESIIKLLVYFKLEHVEGEEGYFFNYDVLKNFLINYSGDYKENISFNDMVENLNIKDSEDSEDSEEDNKVDNGKLYPQTKVHKFDIINLLNDNANNIREFIGNTSVNDVHYAKYMLWLFASLNADECDFTYLRGNYEENEDSLYYDLITISYLGNDYAIPVPVLATILGCRDILLYSIFPIENMKNRNDFEFI